MTESINGSHIMYYMAHGDLKEGDYVVDKDDYIFIRKKGEVPIGIVKSKYGTSEYVFGDTVPVEIIWYGDRLLTTLKLDGQTFYRGDLYKHIKILLNGGSEKDYCRMLVKEADINQKIRMLKKEKEDLWKRI